MEFSLHWGSVLSPLLFVGEKEVITKELQDGLLRQCRWSAMRVDLDHDLDSVLIAHVSGESF